MTRGTSQVTLDSQLCSSSARTVDHVYDVLNAGPRHRFQTGRLITANSQYGMGRLKFEKMCELWDVDLERAGLTADGVVKAYRSSHPRIVAGWRALDDAAQLAVRNGGPVQCCRAEFWMDGACLVMRFPSGRRMVYRDARIEMRVPAYCKMYGMPDEEKPTIIYRRPRGWEGQLYGGRLLENLVQGLCSDFMRNMLVRAEKENFLPFLHAHDEVVCESGVSAEELGRAMCVRPEWAEGFPMAVEAFQSLRYSKKPMKGTKAIKVRS